MTSDDERPDQPWQTPVEPPTAPGAPALPSSAPPAPPPLAPAQFEAAAAPVLPEPPVQPDPPAQPEPPLAAPAPPEAPGYVPTAPGGTYPAGVYAADTTVLGTPVEPIAAAPAPKKRGGIVALVIGAVVVIGGLFLKFGLPLLVGTAVSGVLGGVFGGPFQKLPSDQRQALEQRFDAAVGETLKGLSDADTGTKVDAMLRAGLPRLGDELLVDKVHLTVKLLKASDEATCARVARATATGKDDAKAMSAAISALDTGSIGRWFDINVSAIEAEAKGAPAQRTVVKADSDRVLGDVFAKFSDTEAQQIGSLYNGGETSDADACNAFRALYVHIEELPAPDLALAALYDVTP